MDRIIITLNVITDDVREGQNMWEILNRLTSVVYEYARF